MRGINVEALPESRWPSAANENFEVGERQVVSSYSGWSPYQVWECRVKTASSSSRPVVRDEDRA